MRLAALLLLGTTFACGPSAAGGDDTTATVDSGPVDGRTPLMLPDGSNVNYPDGGPIVGCPTTGCYTVYAHSDHVLYLVDLASKNLVQIGKFNAPKVQIGTMMVEDVITDLAVSPTDVIYAVSETALYTVDARDGHVTRIGPLKACGTRTVALTFSKDGLLYAADYKGAFCKIDITATPPVVTQVGTLGGGLAISGDLVAVGDGTMYGTAYKLSDASNAGTQINNLLVKIDPTTGAATQTIGPTGSPKLFGIAYAQGEVFGFTHDGSGKVVTIDPMTGVGTLYATFTDPTSGTGIAFAGAGVNAKVAPRIN